MFVQFAPPADSLDHNVYNINHFFTTNANCKLPILLTLSFQNHNLRKATYHIIAVIVVGKHG